MVQKLQKDNKGFTIIEVLIVLAIAALIMLIVFLAIPALQRNQRNTSRRNDVGRVGSVSTEFITNNNGALPAAGNEAVIEASAGQLSQYVAGYLTIRAVTSGTNGGNVAGMILETAAECGANGASAGGNPRSMVILYTVEGAAADQDVCQEI